MQDTAGQQGVYQERDAAFVDKMWDIGLAIRNCNYLELEYKKSTNNKVVKRRVKPVAIMFSEFYFYLTAFIDDEKVKANFQVIDDAFPTIYRIDRIAGYKILDKKDGVYTVSAEVFGEGINVWLRSQGENVEVVE